MSYTTGFSQDLIKLKTGEEIYCRITKIDADFIAFKIPEAPVLNTGRKNVFKFRTDVKKRSEILSITKNISELIRIDTSIEHKFVRQDILVSKSNDTLICKITGLDNDYVYTRMLKNNSKRTYPKSVFTSIVENWKVVEKYDTVITTSNGNHLRDVSEISLFYRQIVKFGFNYGVGYLINPPDLITRLPSISNNSIDNFLNLDLTFIVGNHLGLGGSYSIYNSNSSEIINEWTRTKEISVSTYEIFINPRTFLNTNKTLIFSGNFGLNYQEFQFKKSFLYQSGGSRGSYGDEIGGSYISFSAGLGLDLMLMKYIALSGETKFQNGIFPRLSASLGLKIYIERQ